MITEIINFAKNSGKVEITDSQLTLVEQSQRYNILRLIYIAKTIASIAKLIFYAYMANKIRLLV